MLRWGILGAGAVAGSAFAPALRAAGHDLAVVGSSSLTRAQGFAANHGARRARAGYAEVISAPDVDAVYVGLADDAHEQWSIAALEAGKHVLCEKPLSVDATSAARMAAASAATGAVLMEAAMSRFHPRTVALLELLRGGAIGEVALLHAAFVSPMSQPPEHRMCPEHGGGALLDVGFFGAATARWVVGDEPDLVRGLQRRASSGVDLTTTFLLGFRSGAQASVHASFGAVAHQVLEIVGTAGVLQVPEPFTAGRHGDAVLLRDGREVGSWRADPYEEMVRAFADGVAAGAAPLPVDDAVATAEVLDRVRRVAALRS